MRQRYSLARLAGIDKKNHTLVNIKFGSPSIQDLLSKINCNGLGHKITVLMSSLPHRTSRRKLLTKKKKVESHLFNKSSLRHLPNLDRAVLEGANNSPCVERVEVKVEDVALFVEEWI